MPLKFRTKQLNIDNGLAVTGSLTVVGGITGSLFGTSSWANNGITASYVETAQTASYVNTLNQNVTILGNLTVAGSSSSLYVLDVNGPLLVSGTANLYGSVIISGSLTVTDTITELSTRRIKDNINPITHQLSNVLKLNPVHYTMKTTGQEQYGLLSEEVKEIYPEFVHNEGINYSKMVSVLIASIKELKMIIDNQQKQIELLRME